MINPDDADIGTTVYLRPTTKQAPVECYRRLAAVLLSVSTWPMVKVRIFDTAEGREIVVHRDNIGLRRKTVKKEKQGDMTGNVDDESTAMVGKPYGRPIPHLELPDGWEQTPLF